MKWKEFFASTLPRSRKSRKKSSKHSEYHENSGALSSPECDDVTLRHQKSRSDVINGNKKKKRSSSSSKVNEQLTQIAYNPNLVSPDFIYASDCHRDCYTNPYGHQTLSKSYSNASESGFEDGYDTCNYGLCDSHTDSKWCCAAFDPQTQTGTQPDLLPSLNHTFPRERTRIKTNPWVSSHSNKAMTSSFYSQAGDTSPLTATNVPPYLRDFQNNEILTPLSPNSNCNNGNYKSATDSESSDTDWFGNTDKRLLPRQYSYEGNGNDESLDFTETENKRYEDADASEAGVVKGRELVINLNTGDIFVKPKPKPVFSTISFHYEDDLDKTLEKDSSSRKRRSRKHREELRSFQVKDTMAGHHLGDENQPRDVVMDFLEDSSQCSDTCKDGQDGGTLTRSSADAWTYETSDTKSFRKRGLHKREVKEEFVQKETKQRTHAPHENIIYRVVDRRHTKSTRTECQGAKDVTFESFYTRDYTDSAYDSSTLSSQAGSSFHGQLSSLERADESAQGEARPTTLPGIKSRNAKPKTSQEDVRRSLEQIHSSLKEKVDQLRAEKRIVDAKVKQAKEEEEFKREEKAKIQQEVSSLRKQVLLRTLQELKENLEDQSGRLQEAYDDVLDMQWINAKLRRLRNTTI